MYCPDNYQHPGVVHVSLARFELQSHKQVKFKEENIFPYYISVFEQLGGEL